MNTSRFFHAFTIAISWNAFFYIVYKLSFVALTFVLYKRLPSSYFSLWATANSIIFLLLLWLNCGLKKSIPRFAPIFSKNPTLHKQFIYGLLAFKITILMVGIPILLICLQKFSPTIVFLPLIVTLFVSEGLSSLMLLVYHAHFWQKQFNLIQTLFLMLEMLSNFIFLALYFKENSLDLVQFLFASKLFANCGTIAVSLFLIPRFYKQLNLYIGQESMISVTTTVKDFIKHSCFMWATGIIQSLSERNFLFPLIVVLQGAEVANLFKVIHDAAIFFQRIATKTVGIADTALLSYIELSNDSILQIRLAFTAIFKTILTLSVPLFCIGIVMFFKNHIVLSQSSINIFLIVAAGSVLEMIFSPYGRVLEVKRNYKELTYSYIPYLIGSLATLILYSYAFISFLLFIALLHLLRLICTCIMVYYARKAYQVAIPSYFSAIIIGISFCITACVWICL